ncbi:hypothetical protein GCM10007304_48130 [Rhodococcoides trifolii]|uniref:Uncharacterized protein n=1 Tax=Rhodococcoides trifolii TaxID=908250 RepID=A0A917LIY6_9NOCA|nr:hypothetical protein GCM10007304_48130 [Rhodococcus trifolii]
MVDGVEAGNFDTAEHTMRTHLRAVFDDVERIKAKSPQLFSNGSERPTRKVVSSWERGDAVNGEYPDQLRKDIAEFVSQHAR